MKAAYTLGSSPLETMLYNYMLDGKVWLDFFTYRAQWASGALTANGTIPQSTTINADSDFVIQMINLVSYSDVNTIIANPNYLLTIVDGGSGRQLTDNAIHVQNITGQFRNSGSEPFPLPMTKLIRGASQITSTLQNLTAVAATVDLAYIGFKVFYLGGNTRDNLLRIL